MGHGESSLIHGMWTFKQRCVVALGCVFDCATIACALWWRVPLLGDSHYWALLTHSWYHISGAGQLLVDDSP